MLRNTSESYGSVCKFFHWIIALIIIGLLAAGFIMTSMDNSPVRGNIYFFHKATGLLLMALVATRIIWVSMNPKPKLPMGTPKWEIALEHLGHFALYALMILMPLAGWLMSTAAGHIPSFYGLFKVPMPGIEKSDVVADLANVAHSTLAWLIIIMVSLHIIAALKHHFWNRDNVLKRML